MTKVRIQLISKNESLIGNRIEIKTQYVPRVGELIDMNDFIDRENPIFMITSVINKVTKEGIIPYITAKNWLKGNREEILEEFGWLSNKSNSLRYYDEDYYTV